MAAAVDDASIDYVKVKIEFIKKLKDKLHLSIDDSINKLESLATAWMGSEKSLKSFQIMSQTLEDIIIFLTGQVEHLTPDSNFVKNLLARISQAEENDCTETNEVVNNFTKSKNVVNEFADLNQPPSERLSLEKEISALATALSLKNPNAAGRLNFLLNYELGKYPQMRDMVLEMANKEDALSFFGLKNSVPVEESQKTQYVKAGGGQISESPAQVSSQGQVCKCDHVLESIKAQQATLQRDLVNLFKNQNDLENQLSQVKVLDTKFTDRLSNQDAKLQMFADSISSPRPDTEMSKKLSDCAKEIEFMKRNTNKNNEIYKKRITDAEARVNALCESQSKCNREVKSISQKQTFCDNQISILLEKNAYSERRQEDQKKEFDNVLKSYSVKQSSIDKKIESVSSAQSKLKTDLNVQHDNLKDDLEKLVKGFQGVGKRMDNQTKVNLENQKLIEDFNREMSICKSHIDSLLGKPVPSNLADKVEEISKQQKSIQQQEKNTVMTLTDLIQQYSNLEQSFVALTSKVDALKKTVDCASQISLSGFTKFSVRLNQTEQTIRTIKRALEKKLQKHEQTHEKLSGNISELINRTDTLVNSAVEQSDLHKDLNGCIQHILTKGEANENQLMSVIEKVNTQSDQVVELRETQATHAVKFEHVESILVHMSERMNCFAESLGLENVQDRDDSDISSDAANASGSDIRTGDGEQQGARQDENEQPNVEIDSEEYVKEEGEQHQAKKEEEQA
ncbi:hypothetical protein Btru_044240 [Bulinus truncatus]|nr:hypothetical protein Btru_044240 [Bulinus truncatus]